MNPTKGRTTLRTFIALAAALGLSACASQDSARMETATRDAPIASPLSAAPVAQVASGFKVVDVTVNVPHSLRVSEANRYYPSGDIVWREDPIGDRHAQVKAIVEAGLTRGVSQLQGDRPVVLQVMVTRFHALTEKARYTVGGVHEIRFYMTVLDAETGETLVPARLVKANFDAYGGQTAIVAVAHGETQKVRITDHLARVIRREMAG